jgi:alpha-L-fucosidase
VTTKGNKLFLAVFDWPASGKLYLPGLKTPIVSARLLKGDQSEASPPKSSADWTSCNSRRAPRRSSRP